MCNDVRDIMIQYSLPISRGKESIYDFLEKHYEKFINRIIEITTNINHQDFPEKFYLRLRDYALPLIKQECNMILGILALDRIFKPNEMREKFYELMEFMHKPDYPIPFFRELPINGTLIRIRAGEGPYERKDLFHIPFYRRELVSSQRYSIPGNPCLYLAGSYVPTIFGSDMDSLMLCWTECGMPMNFYASIFETQKELQFFHFAKSSIQYLKEYENAKNNKDEYEQRDRRIAIMQYLMSYPLRAACSIKVENKKSNFFEEYIIPQLLLAWIREDNKYIGIAYQTSAALKPYSEHFSINFALPAKNIDPTDGFCIDLKKFFKITKPQHLSLKDRMVHFQSEIDKVNKYALKLEEKLNQCEENSLHPYRHLLSLCTMFISACSMIKDNHNINANIPYQIFNCIRRSSLIIYKSIKNAKSAEDWVEQYKTIKADVLSTNDMIDILEEFCNISSSAFHDLLHEPFPPLEDSGIFSITGLESI